MDLLSQLKKEAKRFFKNDRGAHNWDHVKRVYNLCLQIGKKEEADLEILKISALLHDIAREKEYNSKGKICHAIESAKLAEKILKKYNFPEEKIKKIVHCIETHRCRNNKIPKTKEAEVFFDADKLDSVGAIGIARTFQFAGEVGARLHNDKNTDLFKTEPYTIEDTGYREFMLKLRKIKDKMLTKEGKRIAEKRHKFMEEFFERLNKEVDGAC